MDTQSLTQAVNQVNQAAQAQQQQTSQTIEGVFAVTFALFVIVLFSAILAGVLKQKARKCPKCGNWRHNKPAVQTVRSGNKTTTKRVIVCAKCEHEFVV